MATFGADRRPGAAVGGPAEHTAGARRRDHLLGRAGGPPTWTSWPPAPCSTRPTSTGRSPSTVTAWAWRWPASSAAATTVASSSSPVAGSSRWSGTGPAPGSARGRAVAPGPVDWTQPSAELADRDVALARPPALEPWGLVEAWVDDPGRGAHPPRRGAGRPPPPTRHAPDPDVGTGPRRAAGPTADREYGGAVTAMPDAVVSATAYWTSVVVVLGLCGGLCLLALRRPGPWTEVVHPGRRPLPGGRRRDLHRRRAPPGDVVGGHLPPGGPLQRRRARRRGGLLVARAAAGGADLVLGAGRHATGAADARSRRGVPPPGLRGVRHRARRGRRGGPLPRGGHAPVATTRGREEGPAPQRRLDHGGRSGRCADRRELHVPPPAAGRVDAPVGPRLLALVPARGHRARPGALHGARPSVPAGPSSGRAPCTTASGEPMSSAEAVPGTGLRLVGWRDKVVLGVVLAAFASGFGQFGEVAALGSVARTFGHVAQDRDALGPGRVVGHPPRRRPGGHPPRLARRPAPDRTGRPHRSSHHAPGHRVRRTGGDRGRRRQPRLLVVRRHLRPRSALPQLDQRPRPR